MTDDELLALWRNGDADAASQLFERHFDALYRFFRNKAPSFADDLVQKTLLACFEGRDRFRGESRFRTYLFGIARNQLLMWFAEHRGDAESSDRRESLADLDPSPSVVEEVRQEQQLILQALRRLPLDAQVLLELFYWEQLSGLELAEVLGVPEGTIRSRLRRARQLLGESIAELEREPSRLASTLSNLDDWASKLRAELSRPR